MPPMVHLNEQPVNVCQFNNLLDYEGRGYCNVVVAQQDNYMPILEGGVECCSVTFNDNIVNQEIPWNI